MLATLSIMHTLAKVISHTWVEHTSGMLERAREMVEGYPHNCGWVAWSSSNIISAEVPTVLKPTPGNVQEGLSSEIMNNTIAESSCVSAKVPNHHIVDLYTIGDNSEVITQPFVHEVGLKGNEGVVKVEGLFGNGAMVNSIVPEYSSYCEAH
jgi:hypothetical protein